MSAKSEITLKTRTCAEVPHKVMLISVLETGLLDWAWQLAGRLGGRGYDREAGIINVMTHWEF